MLWRGRRESSNIEDRRGGRRSGGMTRAVGGGGLGLVILVVIASLLGVDPSALLQGLNSSGEPVRTERAPSGGGKMSAGARDEMRRFVGVVLADTEDVWTKIFSRHNGQYEKPTLVLFTSRVQSACGFAKAATGPFYCPGDRRIYIDLGFYELLKRNFAAPGDFAQAYVIAHEVGHHVQNLTGILGKFNQARRTMSAADANRYSVRIELQADCYAGIWARFARNKGYVQRGDLDEALNAARQIGDDAIQKRTQGYVVPDSFNHGSSEQRRRWFLVGYEKGAVSACNTLASDRL